MHLTSNPPIQPFNLTFEPQPPMDLKHPVPIIIAQSISLLINKNAQQAHLLSGPILSVFLPLFWVQFQWFSISSRPTGNICHKDVLDMAACLGHWSMAISTRTSTTTCFYSFFRLHNICYQYLAQYKITVNIIVLSHNDVMVCLCWGQNCQIQ